MTERIAIIALGLAAVTGAAILVLKPTVTDSHGAEPPPSSIVSATQVPPADAPGSHAIAAADALSNAVPPPEEALRGDPQLQSAYDQQAQVGEFVTPPSVSIEH